MKSLSALAISALLASCASPGGPSVSSGSTADAKPYPLTTCVVSGRPLGSRGKPITRTAADREVKFCCGECVEPFERDPWKYLGRLP